MHEQAPLDLVEELFNDISESNEKGQVFAKIKELPEDVAVDAVSTAALDPRFDIV